MNRPYTDFNDAYNDARMTLTVQLLVDSRGWPTPLDPEVVSSIVQGRLQTPLDVNIQARQITDRWYEALPRGEVVLFLFLTRTLTPGWEEVVKYWLGPSHRLYILHINEVDQADIRTLAQFTVAQPVARAPYRIFQQNAAGLDEAAKWIGNILIKLADAPDMPPPVKITPTRWRNLPSNRQDMYASPDQFTASVEGTAGYKMTSASFRGKTHAHQGTFREDATAIAATPYWNIMAVADGAGTAPLARVGSNTAVTAAVAAMREAVPTRPQEEDLGKAIWAGLKAADTAIRAFATDNNVLITDLHTTLQLMIHWPQPTGCLLGLAHIGDGIIAAETPNGQYYLLTTPDVDPDDAGRTLFLTSGPVRRWMKERTHVYQFDEPLDIVALMTDGLSGDLEPYADLLHTNLFEALRNRVLCYPLKQREQALLAFISYDRRGSFDDRTLAILSRE